MVASAPQSQSQSQTKPLSPEEELLKKNTDCVYFLASPLTCKKGNECEYRHSDNARVNPRDCYFWLHGNCLNPKCAFRHPPLEGLLGIQVPTSTGPSASISKTVMADSLHVTSAVPTKPGIPTCVFFQKGYCMKGDWCPFLHAPNSLINKPAPMPVTAPLAEPAANKKALIGLEKTVQKKKDCPVNAAIKSVKDSVVAKPTFKVELVSHTNEFILNRRAPQTAPVSNGNLVNWPVHVQHYRQLDETEPENLNNKDTEEFSRELSPGFDVLVDDDVRDTDYYPGEDGYGILREHEVRNEYNIGLSTDNDERYQSSIGYDSHGPRNGQYGWEQQRGLSERSSGGPYSERRPYSRPDAVGQDDGLDLRHRLQKQKKSNGLRSVISNEYTRDMQGGDRISYREENRNSSRENFLSSRLRGRISLPGISQSPDNNRDNMIRGRLSPARVNISAYQGRARERVRGRVEEGFSNYDNNNNSGGKSYSGPHSRRDEGAAGFSGPKSLAELKKKKNEEPSRRYVSDQQQSLGKRKHQESGNAISFEGPKPLQEILKRKRSEKTLNSSGNEGFSENKIIEEGKDHEINNETVTHIQKNDEVYTDDDNHNNSTKQEGEDGVLDDQDGEELYEQQQDGGESDYEQVGGEDDDLYDGENREYVDEDDDDFAKKMGVVYS